MRAKFQFSSVSRVPLETWSRASILAGSHTPGTIFLTGEPGRCGGILKLDRGLFLTLSRDEVYLQAWAQWPASPVLFRIVGDTAEFDLSALKREPKPSRGVPSVDPVEQVVDLG